MSVWIFVGTWIGFNRIGSTPTLRERLKPAAALLLQALPLMFAFFVIFPRATGPLWAMPQGLALRVLRSYGIHGAGYISNLIKSDALAFRVQFDGDRPAYSKL